MNVLRRILNNSKMDKIMIIPLPALWAMNHGRILFTVFTKYVALRTLEYSKI